MRNYYEILGISRNATQAQIKAAYRKLAKKYHPDSAGSSEDKERFQEIQEAYAVLSDPEKRKMYHYYGHEAYRKSYHAQHAPYEGSGDARTKDGHCGACAQGREEDPEEGPPPSSIRIAVWLELSETLQAVTKEVTYTDRAAASHRSNTASNNGNTASTGGSSASNNSNTSSSGGSSTSNSNTSSSGGSSASNNSNASSNGGGFASNNSTSSSGGSSAERSWTFHVKIPAGAYENQFFVLEDILMDGQEFLDYQREARPDKVFVIIVLLREKPGFTRQGYHLYTDLTVDYHTLVLGGSAKVPGLDGEISFEIPAGTKPERKLRLVNQGLIRPKKMGGRGDLYVNLHIRIPQELTIPQLSAMLKLREALEAPPA